MIKLFKIYLTFTIYCFSLNNTFSQCEIIPPYTSLPTGSNMTVFLTPGFFQTIPNLSPGAYIVGLSPQGTTFGSTEIYNANQTLVVIHGDDTTTPEIDGMLAGDEVIFKIVSGDSIYHVDMLEPILYSTNQLYQIINASFELECPQDEVIGCMDLSACNYNDQASISDESCIIAIGCDECSGRQV